MALIDFNELVQHLSRKLYGYAFRILVNKEEAEDAVQEVFIKLWNMGEKLEEYKSLDALATTMVKNYCIDQFRKKKLFIKDDSNNEESKSLTVPSPLDEMESIESMEILDKIIEQMPDSYREAIQLRDIDGLSYEEISAKTNQNINTIRVTISRARKIIRNEYNKYQYERKGFEKTAQ